jgi:hypothetical protein
MSVGLSAIQQIEFDAQVKAAYQKAGLLRPHVRVKTNVVGNTARFRRYSRGQATVRVPQTNVIPMGTTYGNADAVLSDWNAAEYTDVFDQQKTNVDERPVVAANIAAAIGRREDQLILDAADVAGGTVTDTVLTGATDLTMAKLRRVKRIHDSRAVPMNARCFLHSAQGLEALLGLTEATSADFNAVRTLVNGELSTFLGFKFVMIEDRDEGGLPKAGNVRTSYSWDMAAVGLAIGIEFRTEVAYINEKTSWLANGLFSAGAVGIDPLGIVELQTTEAA